MTREEAKEIISRHHWAFASMDDEVIEAIECLAEDCEDAISRQAVMDALCHSCELFHRNGEQVCLSYCEEYHFLVALPSVTQKPKMGRWIMPVQDDGMSDPIYYQVRCSECGFDLDPQTWHIELHQYGADKYCPNCGARMGESED